MMKGTTEMFKTPTDTVNPHSCMIIATLMMLLTLGFTEAFKDNAIAQEDLFYNYGCNLAKKLGFDSM